MKKIVLAFLVVSFSVMSFAHAGILADRAQKIADQLSAIERSLNPRDAADISYALDQIDYFLYRYGGDRVPDQAFTCVSDGGEPFQKYHVYHLQNGENWGGATGLAVCQKLVSTSTRSYICLSDGGAPFEKFTLWDRKNGRYIGTGTGLDTCLNTMPH